MRRSHNNDRRTTLEKSVLFKAPHNFLKQEPDMSTQGWHTLVISGYKKYNFPTAVNDRLQRDIFIIGLNDTFKLFCSEVFARENSSTLSFTQVIFKARDFEAALKTELAIAKHRFEEAAHKITPAIEKSKLRTGLHVFQVRRPAFKVGAHHMQTTVTPRLKQHLPWRWKAGSLETSMQGRFHTLHVKSRCQPWS